MIAVYGSTGKIGRHLVAELSERNVEFRCLVRNLGRAREVLGPNVSLVQTDMESRTSMAAALRGVERLFLLTGHHPAQSGVQNAVVDAAVGAGVPHIVKLSAGEAIVNERSAAQIGREHWKTEQHIRKSGVLWTFLRPGFFMQNFCEMADLIRATRTVAMPAPNDTVVGMVDVKDIALAAAETLTSAGHEFKAYSIAGNDYALADFPQILSEELRMRFAYLPMSDEAAAFGMRQGGMEDWMIDQQISLFHLMRHGAFSSRSSHFQEITGRPYRTLDAFVSKHREMFQPI